MRECPNGHWAGRDNVKFCPECGAATVHKLSAEGEERYAKSANKNVLAVLVLMAIAFGAYLYFGQSRSSRAPTPYRSPTVYRAPTSSTAEVTYRVTGTTKKASLTYNNAQNGTDQTDVERFGTNSLNSQPWTKTFTLRAGAFAYLAAQNGQSSGSITAEILINGRLLKSSTSKGQYVIASCSGTVGQ